jgi:hypothetical protein
MTLRGTSGPQHRVILEPIGGRFQVAVAGDTRSGVATTPPTWGIKTPHLADALDAVDASHVSQGLAGHHPRRVRRPRRVVWGFLVSIAKNTQGA